MLSEAKLQYQSDGSNFEASTSYHRLSTEMLVYGTALTLGLPYERFCGLRDCDMSVGERLPRQIDYDISRYIDREKKTFCFPVQYLDQIKRMGEFTVDLTKPDHRISQIGDNDNGRFLKLSVKT